MRILFRFYGDSFDPDEITRRLKIEPTAQRRPGDLIRKEGQGRYKDYAWMVEVGPSATLDIEDMLQEMRRQMNVAPEDVKQLCADLNLDLVIVCGVSGEDADTQPAMFFPTEFLEWVVDLGASLNVDVIA